MPNSDRSSPLDIDASVNTAIQQTERYYREQIFSSGCSSLVPIYRINQNTGSANNLIQQLEGTPYIQKDIEFSERVITTLLDIDIYLYKKWHFFVQGELNNELSDFIDNNCTRLDSINQVVQQSAPTTTPKWNKIEQNIQVLVARYPVLSALDYQSLASQITVLLAQQTLDSSLENYLELFYQPEWEDKYNLNQAVLLCMMAIGNKLALSQHELEELVQLALLKDIGYARLSEEMVDFEIMHPLVSHRVLTDCNSQIDHQEQQISENLLDAVLMHHEFIDASGPLSRMRHPKAIKLMGDKLPAIAQISGLCDLYFGFLEKYSPGTAYAITCGFVMGQGDVKPRYNIAVIEAFMQVIKLGAVQLDHTKEDEADHLVSNILESLRNTALREKFNAVIHAKTKSNYDRITLSLNVVRNIAMTDPKNMAENALVKALHLPIEFGLNY